MDKNELAAFKMLLLACVAARTGIEKYYEATSKRESTEAIAVVSPILSLAISDAVKFLRSLE